jgi:hypothetical protein
MDSSQSPTLNHPRVGVDVTAELTAPPPDPAWQPAPVAESASMPSAKSFELIDQLDALARDFASSKRGSSNQCVETSEEASSISAGLQPEESVIHVSPRDRFTRDGSSIGRRITLTLAILFVAALVGVGATFAWQTHRFSTTKSPIDVTEQTGSTAASHLLVQDAALPQSAPVSQTPPAPATPATSPELVRQLETMAQDLAAVRRNVEQLTATQEQLAAKQEQLAAKQEQMIQNIAKQQPAVQNIRPKISPPPLSRAVPIPPRRNAPRDTPPETAAQLSSVPGPEQNPRPPLPVPP